MTALEAATEASPSLEDVIAAYNRWERSHGALYGLAPVSGTHDAEADDLSERGDDGVDAAPDVAHDAAGPVDVRSAAAHLAHLPEHVAATYLTSHAKLIRQAWVDPDALRRRIVQGQANTRCLIGLGVDPDDALDYLPLNDTHALASVTGVPQHELLATLRTDIEAAMAHQLPDNISRAARTKQRQADLELTLQYLKAQVTTVTGQDTPTPHRRFRWMRRR